LWGGVVVFLPMVMGFGKPSNSHVVAL
jgi:hypothetical protein